VIRYKSDRKQRISKHLLYLCRTNDSYMNILPHAPTVIIANGRFPRHPVPRSWIEKAGYIVCTDGAANDFIDRGGKPDAIVGDCDSLSEEYSKRYAHILHPNPDQDTNDLTKSVQFCVQNGKREIVIVGATGKGRITHWGISRCWPTT